MSSIQNMIDSRQLKHDIFVFIALDESLEIPYNEDRKYWDEWVNKVTEALNPLDLEFAHVHDEFSGEHVYGIVRHGPFFLHRIL